MEHDFKNARKSSQKHPTTSAGSPLRGVSPSPYSTPSPPPSVTPEADQLKYSEPQLLHDTSFNLNSQIERESMFHVRSLVCKCSESSMYIVLFFFVSLSSVLIYFSPYLSLLLAFHLHPDDNFFSLSAGKNVHTDLRSSGRTFQQNVTLNPSTQSIVNSSVATISSSAAPIPSMTTTYLPPIGMTFPDNPSICPNLSLASNVQSGFSGKYLELISVYFFAQLKNVTFCTVPWHSPDGSDDDLENRFTWVGGPKFGPVALDSTEMIQKKMDLFTEKKLTRRFPKVLKGTLEFTQAAYFSTPKPKLMFYDRGRFDIAVHIQASSYKENVEDIDMCLWKLKIKYKPRRDELDMHLFSTGDEDTFTQLALNHPKMKLHLNKDMRAVFHHLVMADVLLISKAKFSKTAALLSTWGDIFYINLKNPPVSDWSGCSSLGWR